jgi:hypothetical protein
MVGSGGHPCSSGLVAFILIRAATHPIQIWPSWGASATPGGRHAPKFEHGMRRPTRGWAMLWWFATVSGPRRN